MAQPALDVFRSLDQALAAAVAAAAPSVVHVSRGHGAAAPASSGPTISSSARASTLPTAPRSVVADRRRRPRRARRRGHRPRSRHRRRAPARRPAAGSTPATLRELDDLAVGNLALALGRPGRTARASLRAIGVLGPEVRTPWGGRLDRYVESDRQIPRGFAGGPLDRRRRRGDRHEHADAAARRRPRDPDRHARAAWSTSCSRTAACAAATSASARIRRSSRAARAARGRDAARSSRASRTAARPRPPGVLVGDMLVEARRRRDHRPRRACARALGDRPGEAVDARACSAAARSTSCRSTLGSKP